MVKVKMPVWVKYYVMSLCSFPPSLLTGYQTGLLVLTQENGLIFFG